MNCKTTYAHGHSRRVFICLIWFAGSLLGCLSFRILPAKLLSMMCLVPLSRVSIVGVLCVLILPALSAVVAIQYSLNVLAYILIFIKTFLYTFAFSWLSFSYGDSAWLVRFLVLFSDTIVLPVLFLFLFTLPTGNEASIKRSVVHLIVFILIVGCIDYCFISPFTVRVFIQ